MKYTMDHLLLVTLGLAALTTWSLFIMILMECKELADLFAVIGCLGVGGWVGFTFGVVLYAE